MSDSPPFVFTGIFMCSKTMLPTGYAPMESSDVYDEIEDMLVENYPDGILQSRFETTYKKKFKRSLDYNLLGVKTIEELLDVMCEKGMVVLDKDPKTNDRNVKLARLYKGSSDVYQEIEDMLVENYPDGILQSRFETTYKKKFKRSLDYNHLGVKTIEELLDVMCEEGMVVLDKDPKTNDRNVKLARLYKGSSDVYQEIENMLAEYYPYGISESRFETIYKEMFETSLDYNLLGVETIAELLDKMCEEGIVLLDKTNDRNVKLARLYKVFVYQEIENMLGDYYPDGISESRFETTYKEMFKRSLDYDSVGVKTIKELLDKMCEEGILLLDKDPKTNDRNVKLACLYKGSSEPPTESSEIHDRPTKSSDLYQEIQQVLKGAGIGITMYWLEQFYLADFGRLPDYGSVRVNDIKELIGKMRNKGRVLVYEEPESKETYVMCAWLADSCHKLLKRSVLEILYKHGGEMTLSHFEREFKDSQKVKLKYHYYGLKDIYHLCEVFNLGLEEADSPPGEKVIKARKIHGYNLRKRKTDG